MIPKGSSKFYPPSEYKENFVPFPIQEKVKSYSDVLNESPITLSFAKNTQDWQTQYKKSFQPFEPESIHELGPVAGSAPVEDVGRLAPTFFAWELNAPLPAGIYIKYYIYIYIYIYKRPCVCCFVMILQDINLINIIPTYPHPHPPTPNRIACCC